MKNLTGEWKRYAKSDQFLDADEYEEKCLNKLPLIWTGQLEKGTVSNRIWKTKYPWGRTLASDANWYSPQNIGSERISGKKIVFLEARHEEQREPLPVWMKEEGYTERQFTSGMLCTQNNYQTKGFNFQTGRLVMKCKIPWVWGGLNPAGWTLVKTRKVNGKDSILPEVDFFEYFTQLPPIDVPEWLPFCLKNWLFYNRRRLQINSHWGSYEYPGHIQKPALIRNFRFDKDFYIYEVDYQKDRWIFRINGLNLMTIEVDQLYDHFPLLTLAVPDRANLSYLADKLDKKPARMYIEYVKLYDNR